MGRARQHVEGRVEIMRQCCGLYSLLSRAAQEVRQLAVDFGARLARLPESMPGVRRIVEQLRELPSVDEPEALGLFGECRLHLDVAHEASPTLATVRLTSIA